MQHVKTLTYILLLLSFGVCAPALTNAQDCGLTPKLHPWGQFGSGSRAVVYVVTETFNEQGQVVGTSATDTATTLVDSDQNGVTLEVESCVEVVGKRFDGKPQVIKQGFHGELRSLNVKIGTPTDTEFSVDDRKIPCKVQKLEYETPNGKTVCHITYSPTVAPYVFKRESSTIDTEGKLSDSLMEVTSMEMPWRVLGELMNVYNVKTVRRTPNGTITTLELISPEIPGGDVSRSSKEVDKNGRLIHRSTLELTEYNIESDQDRQHARKRSKPRRTKTNSRYDGMP
jgi:hypothetical protein